MGGGGKIPYPKHVWSPSGGWYAQPANWKSNTVICGLVMLGIAACIFKLSAEREEWHHKPASEDFAPSRYWSRQLREWDKEDRLKAEKLKAEKLKAEQSKAEQSKGLKE